MPKQPKRWSYRKGQSAVELAIVAPVLALLLVVVSDFARVFFVSIAVNNAARAGAQFGSQSVQNADEPDKMQLAASTDFGCVAKGNVSCPNFPDWKTPAASQCTCGTPNPPTAPACAASYCTDAAKMIFVTVNTSATYNTILNYPGIPHKYTLTGQAIMQVQQ
jgi:TadE-like protein